jgi:hypothetical protein
MLGHISQIVTSIVKSTCPGLFDSSNREERQSLEAVKERSSNKVRTSKKRWAVQSK